MYAYDLLHKAYNENLKKKFLMKKKRGFKSDKFKELDIF